MEIPFNQPYYTGNEIEHINAVIDRGKFSGNGLYTRKCQKFFEERFGIKKALLTTSCSDALEMAAILSNVKEGDEVIMPAYTFVSTANAFILRGTRVVFADCCPNSPNIDPTAIEELISPSTKAIVVVHYAGVACDMDAVMAIAKKYNLLVIEDAAQAIGSSYRNRPLGSIGHLATFSFHETKNIIAGEGGLLAINDERFFERADYLWDKGTNRIAFFRGEIPKYEWVDVGSSFMPSELVAAFLWAQLECMDEILSRRKQLWRNYYRGLKGLATLGGFEPLEHYLSEIGNAHIFYLICSESTRRENVLELLKVHGIQATFHYSGLHKSKYFAAKHDGRQLVNCDKFSEKLFRLPLFHELSYEEQLHTIDVLQSFGRVPIQGGFDNKASGM